MNITAIATRSWWGGGEGGRVVKIKVAKVALQLVLLLRL